MFTTEHIGSGQLSRCAQCRLMPTPEGYDGCLGTLDERMVMNACCGHGDESFAYVQFWNGYVVRGFSASLVISGLKNDDHAAYFESGRVGYYDYTQNFGVRAI